MTRATTPHIDTFQVLNAIPHPVVVVDGEGYFSFANSDAEQFFSAGASYLSRRRLADFVPGDSPLFMLIDQVRAQGCLLYTSPSPRD